MSLRAKDIHMAATIDPKTHTVYVTGSIDQKHTSIVTRIKVPESGVWKVVKAETNLTDSAWLAWQIRLGGDCEFADEQEGVSQQFCDCDFIKDRNTILFSRGEVRPGEPVLRRFPKYFIPSSSGG